jgi:hypothetical protein
MPLGNAHRLLDSLWAVLKGYWKTIVKCPYKTDTVVAGQMFLSAGRMR